MQMFAIIVCPLMLTPGSCLSDMGEKTVFWELVHLNVLQAWTDLHKTQTHMQQTDGSIDQLMWCYHVVGYQIIGVI